MPSIEENNATWSRQYHWPQAGDEWSEWWGGTSGLWMGTLYPRISRFLPAGNVLEIAPGYGRCTQFLKQLCRELTIVDLSAAGIDYCRNRFAEDRHIRYFVNDSKSLDMIPDESIDFVFSYDSLVHVERDVMEAYLMQLGRKLKPRGSGFIHHSNLGMYRNEETGELNTDYNPGWRGSTVSAAVFEELSWQAGLHCICQEQIVWWEGTDLLSDCFSFFTRSPRTPSSSNLVIRNYLFPEEYKRIAALSVYDRTPHQAS
jgi:SAM-dependent methyltransferase